VARYTVYHDAATLCISRRAAGNYQASGKGTNTMGQAFASTFSGLAAVSAAYDAAPTAMTTIRPVALVARIAAAAVLRPTRVVPLVTRGRTRTTNLTNTPPVRRACRAVYAAADPSRSAAVADHGA
jgi:hypothetical protein